MWKAYYKDFWHNHRVLLMLAWMSMLASNILTIVLTLLIGKFFELQFSLQSLKGSLLDFFPFSLATNLSKFYLIYGSTLVLKLVFFYYARYLGEKAGIILIKQVKKEVFGWQISIPLSQYRSTGAARYMQRFSGDMNNIKKHFIQGILAWSSDVVIIVIFFIIVFFTHLILGVCMFFLLAVASMFLRRMDNTLYILTELQGNKSSRLFALISNTLNHLETIHVVNRSRIQSKAFHKLNENHAQASLRQSRLEAYYRTAIPLITYLLIFCTLMLATFGHQEMGGSGMITTILLILYITPVLRRVLSSGIIREKGILSWKNIEKVKNLSREEEGRDIKTGKIQLKLKIGKEWQELDPGIHILNHNFPHHFMDNWLMLRAPGKEKITLNGRSISAWKPSQWRKLICPIDDRYGLVGKNLHELICPHLRVFPEQALLRFNSILPPAKQLSLDMNTGENGKLLSPMQKKMVCIMRACYSSSPVIVTRNLMEHIPTKKQILVRELFADMEQDRIILFLEPITQKSGTDESENDSEDDASIVSMIK